MKELNKWQNIAFLMGAVLMVIGSGAYIFLHDWAPYIYCVGALAFVSMQLLQRYEGNNFIIKRLRRIVFLSDAAFLIAGLLMIANVNNFMHLNIVVYFKYIHNNWVVALLIAALLQLYGTHRIQHELVKEAKK